MKLKTKDIVITTLQRENREISRDELSSFQIYQIRQAITSLFLNFRRTAILSL